MTNDVFLTDAAGSAGGLVGSIAVGAVTGIWSLDTLVFATAPPTSIAPLWSYAE